MIRCSKRVTVRFTDFQWNRFQPLLNKPGAWTITDLIRKALKEYADRNEQLVNTNSSDKPARSTFRQSTSLDRSIKCAKCGVPLLDALKRKGV
jgi:hypothetical protein